MDEQIVQVDWDSLGPEEQRAFFSEEGYLLVPQAIDPDHLRSLREELEHFPLQRTEDWWHAPSFEHLIEAPKMVAALENLFGPGIRFFKGVYVAVPPPGSAGSRPVRQRLHKDYDPYGSGGTDFRNSSPSWINCGCYLTDLTPEHAPLWVVPGSHRDYRLGPGMDLEGTADQAKMVLARAGDIVFFYCMTTHAGGANTSNTTRQSVFYSYRAAWAKPVGPISEWPSEYVERAPLERKRLLVGLND